MIDLKRNAANILSIIKTMWGIRHLRYWWYMTAFENYWDQVGKHLHGPLFKRDAARYLEDIWDGKE